MTSEVLKFPRHGQSGYYSLADLPQRESLKDHAISTGWWELDQIFKLYDGQFIVVTGMPGSGKSTFMMNVLCNIAREHDMASFLYVPENEAHVSAKLQGIWGSNKSFGHYAAAKCFVQSSVPEDYNEPPHTLDWVLEKAMIAMERDRVRVLMIDPWNELDRAKPQNMLLTDYIAECLMRLKQFCRATGAIVIMVAHPTKAVAENGGRLPTLSDIEGSMAWFNKCDNGLIVARDKAGNTATVISAKVREIGAGRVGKTHFMVDADTGRFTPQHGAIE